MKQYFIFLFIFITSLGVSLAQNDAFYLELKTDTVLAGNVLEVSFIANNIAGQFEAPDLTGIDVISGPNTSSSMSMVNGTVTQHASYSYGIYLKEIGEVIIPPAYFVTNDGTFETEPTSIIVLPNPEGIIEEPPSQSGLFQFSFPSPQKQRKENKEKVTSKKKKRKLRKI